LTFSFTLFESTQILQSNKSFNKRQQQQATNNNNKQQQKKHSFIHLIRKNAIIQRTATKTAIEIEISYSLYFWFIRNDFNDIFGLFEH